jgi:hypothetical protein
MSTSSDDRNLQALWQSQPSSGRIISLDEIQQHAHRLERRVARRNLREYVAAVIVVAAYGWGMWLIPSLMIRVGAVLIIVATSARGRVASPVGAGSAAGV